MPTRGRPALVERFFRSIRETTLRLDSVEVVLYADEDDIGSHQLDSADFRVVSIVGKALSMGGYNSTCLQQARGDIVILANDDMVIRTRGWDDRVRAIDAEFEDRIYLAYANDLFKRRRFCTFPIMSRRTCQLLRDPYPAAYRRAFIDVHLFDIFKRLQHAGHDRVRYSGELVFEHLHYRTGKAPYDKTYAQTRSTRFADDQTFIALADSRRAASSRLISAIRHEDVPQASDARLDVHAPTGLVAAAGLFCRQFLFDRGLPYRWRIFLFHWFIGRYLAANGFLSLIVRPPNDG